MSDDPKEQGLSDADLWEKKRRDGLTTEQATAYVTSRQQPPKAAAASPPSVPAVAAESTTARARPVGPTNHGSSGTFGGPGDVAPEDKRSPAYNAMNTFAQGASFGFGDEINAATNAAMDQLLGRGKFADSYDRNVNAERSGLRDFRADHPVAAPALEIGGAVVGGLGTGSVLRGAGIAASAAPALSKVPKVARMVGEGAAIGGLTGAGTAEGGAEDRARGALTGSVLGGITGAAVPAIGSAAQAMVPKAVRNAASPVIESLGDRAKAKVLEALQQGGLTLDDLDHIVAQIPDDKPVSLIDVGGRRPGQGVARLAETAATVPSRGAEDISSALGSRSDQQRGRLMQDLETALGAKREDAFQTADDLISSRRANAKPLYEKAYAGAPIEDPEVLATLDLPQFRAAHARGSSIANIERVKLPPLTKTETLGGEEVTSLVPQPIQSLDYIKRGIDAVIENGVGGNTMSRTEARALRGRLEEMLQRVDEVNPDYAEARSQFKGDSQLMEAFQSGRDDFLKMDPREIARSVKGMSAGERDLFKRGAYDALSSKFDDVGYGRDLTKAIFSDPKSEMQVRELFDSPGDFEAWKKSLDVERTMAANKNTVLSGSGTARRQAGQEALSDDQTAGVSIPTNASSAMMQLVRAGMARTRGNTPALVDEIAPLVTAGANGDRDALRQAMQQLTRYSGVNSTRKAGLGTLRRVAEQFAGGVGGQQY